MALDMNAPENPASWRSKPMGAGEPASLANQGSAQRDGSDYRPDIDGLRAIAVAVIVIFHTGVSPLRGGFIGVDIFFVISGFLITRLICQDIERGRFTISGFYERRLRRIFPALVVGVACVLLAAPFLLFPSELRTTALTGAAALASVANIYLLNSAGYFAADAETQPLLHLWSLGVEEQFYVFFPLALLLLMRRGRRAALWATIALAALSLALGIVSTYWDRDFAYYFPLTRAWELLFGALAFFLPAPRLPQVVREIAAFGALALLIACTIKFYPGMYFPGYLAVVPCLATAALISLGGNATSLTSRLLALRPIVFIGLISYSLYIWHWPIIVYYHLVRGAEIAAAEAVGLVAASVLAATLSWYFVERPFRVKTLLASRSSVFIGTGIAGLLLIGAAAGLMLQARAEAAAPDESTRLASYLAYDDAPVYRRGSCFLFSHVNTSNDLDRGKCLTPVAGKPNVLVVGDSHAAHLWSGIASALPDANVMQATSTGCKPVTDARGEKTCTRLFSQIFSSFLPQAKPDILVLSARWIESDIPDIVRTLNDLKGKAGRIVVFGPIVEYSSPLPRLLAQVKEGRDSSLLITARRSEQATTDQAFGAAVRSAGGTYVSAYRLLCATPTAACTTSLDGVPVQWDYGHLTKQGSAYLARLARQAGAFSMATVAK
jgi:peptidoglycan/LPS O-acetylase OafA/YrhL